MATLTGVVGQNAHFDDGTFAKRVLQVDETGTPTSNGGGGGPTSVAGTVSRVTDSGTVASGAYSISFAVSLSAAAGATVGGVTLNPGEFITFPPVGSATYGSISYDATGSDLFITQVR